jgi:prevent-host-death family protein
MDQSQRDIPAGEFKARCLKIMDEVAQDHRPVQITKHGRPVAQLIPIKEEPGSPFGWLEGTVSFRDLAVKPS